VKDDHRRIYAAIEAVTPRRRAEVQSHLEKLRPVCH